MFFTTLDTAFLQLTTATNALEQLLQLLPLTTNSGQRWIVSTLHPHTGPEISDTLSKFLPKKNLPSCSKVCLFWAGGGRRTLLSAGRFHLPHYWKAGRSYRHKSAQFGFSRHHKIKLSAFGKRALSLDERDVYAQWLHWLTWEKLKLFLQKAKSDASFAF